MESSRNSLFIGKSIIHLDKIDSTNHYLSNIISKSNPPEGMVVSADYQSAGVGQVGRKWESKPSENILMSLYLKPTFLSTDHVFFLNIIVSLAFTNVLSSYIEEQRIKIKWPNDIYIDDKKIAGILIKNTVQKNIITKSIIGVGLNVFQTEFDTSIATSMAISTDKKLDKTRIKDHFFYSLEQYYLILRTKNHQQLTDLYQSQLYLKDVSSNFQNLITQESFSGKIRGVTKAGKLSIQTDQAINEFVLHEIKYL